MLTILLAIFLIVAAGALLLWLVVRREPAEPEGGEQPADPDQQVQRPIWRPGQD